MAEWRHPYEDLLRVPLSAKEQLVASACAPLQGEGTTRPAFCAHGGGGRTT
jgi:hypothetical protein